MNSQTDENINNGEEPEPLLELFQQENLLPPDPELIRCIIDNDPQGEFIKFWDWTNEVILRTCRLGN